MPASWQWWLNSGIHCHAMFYIRFLTGQEWKHPGSSSLAITFLPVAGEGGTMEAVGMCWFCRLAHRHHGVLPRGQAIPEGG